MSRNQIVMLSLVCVATFAGASEDWNQLKLDSLRSGNAPERSVRPPLGLVAAVRLTDAVFTAPAVKGGRVFTVDGGGCPLLR